MKSLNPWIDAQWPCPKNVKAITTTRFRTSNQKLFDFNMSPFIENDSKWAKQNSDYLKKELGLSSIEWLKQVHGKRVIREDSPQREADGVWTDKANEVCAVLTADCLPIVLTDKDGSKVCAVHAGWRGLASGIIASGLGPFNNNSPSSILAWLGPAIGPNAFEVGEVVLAQFVQLDPSLEVAFKPSRNANHYYADLYQIARLLLLSKGIDQVYGGNHCTWTEKNEFYSFRRNPSCGRIATLIWKTA